MSDDVVSDLLNDREIVQLKPFEGSTVTFRFDGAAVFEIEDLFDGGPMPADLTAEKLVPLLKEWFGSYKGSMLRELGIEPDVYVSIDNGAEAEIK